MATIPETFEKLKATELYSSGLGYRGKFLIIEEIDNNSPEDVKKSESGISIYEQHKARFANIFETFFFNAVYNSTNENTLLRINDDFNLKIYNDCIRKLWDEFIGNNDDLTDRQKETFKNRLHTKFQKNIQENYVGNYAYSMHFNDNLYPDNGSMLIFPINGKNYIDLSEQDILRGYNATRFDLNKSTVVFSTEERSDLTPRQQKVIELLEVGVAKQAKELLKEAINKNSISKAAFYVLIKRKVNQFTISDNIRHGKLITRNF